MGKELIIRPLDTSIGINFKITDTYSGAIVVPYCTLKMFS